MSTLQLSLKSNAGKKNRWENIINIDIEIIINPLTNGDPPGRS